MPLSYPKGFIVTNCRKTKQMENDLNLKFLALGDSGVGKTCLLNQYVDGKYNGKLAPTVGIDIREKSFQYISEKCSPLKVWEIHLQLWDTAGQERFRSLTSTFFRDAIGFLLVFDLTNENSFLNVRDWITQLQNNAYTTDPDMIIIGNKKDLINERVVDQVRVQQFAQQYNIQYIETSALENINITESMELLLDNVIIRMDKNKDLIKQNPFIKANSSIILTNGNMSNYNNENQKHQHTSYYEKIKLCCN
ncbi:unnamed protein product [Didymodactylos carnosus]|uniref:Uncharacterized protein n=1 Tax=Didymodactylos carnosus TaxID=1234261 RepID=A0A813UH29_9BILA|nr:unnamed protein product [Didymodactylos carnosus]CAF0938175.1 unnamed protein product [Didymodactylos carnosus]CAF3609933.1 unnamed protein product [Didymodactylos carnosus]CAF3713644.1 unnamed protein product [Didymodactylos carnosus]